MNQYTRVHTGLTARARRMVELTTLAASMGLGHLVGMLGLMRLRGPNYRAPTTPERIRDFFSAAGTTFVKLGQKLSTRRDILPPEYIDAFATLQENVPPPRTDLMLDALARELPQDIPEVFSEISDEPVAAASVGVVFRARLKADGREVAVKVRRPGISAQVAVDLAILADVADRLERYLPAMRRYQPKALFYEFARALRGELDFRDEAERTERLREVVGDHPHVSAPAVVKELTTSHLIVTEWIEGVDPGDHDTIDAHGIKRTDLAADLASSVMRQALEEGCFHGDPHPGNIRICADGRAVFLDFGNVVFIGRQSRQYLTRLLTSMFLERADQVTTVLLNAGVVGPNVKIQLFQHDVDQILARHLGERENPDFKALITDFLGCVRAHELGFLPPEWISLLLSVGMAEGLCRTLDPGFNMAAVGRRVARDQRRQRLPRNPAAMMRELLLQIQGLGGFLRQLPTRIERLLTQAESSGLKLRLIHDNTDENLRPVEKMVNRLAGSVILGSMVIAAALLLHQPDQEEFLRKVAFFLLILSAVGASFLLWSMFRSGGT